MISSPPRPVPKLYENFVEEIDAIDNGIAQTDGEPRYALTTNLSARVGHLNPRWNDPDQDTEVGTRGKGGDAELRSLGSPLTFCCVPRRGLSGQWSWWAASSWTGSTTITVPGCLHGRSWRTPSGAALRCSPCLFWGV